MEAQAARFDERLKRLEEWREEREKERDVFRRNWSQGDVEKLRLMLNGYIAAAAVKAFWSSFSGRAVIVGVALVQIGSFTLAIVNLLRHA